MQVTSGTWEREGGRRYASAAIPLCYCGSGFSPTECHVGLKPDLQFGVVMPMQAMSGWSQIHELEPTARVHEITQATERLFTALVTNPGYCASL